MSATLKHIVDNYHGYYGNDYVRAVNIMYVAFMSVNIKVRKNIVDFSTGFLTPQVEVW